MGSGCGLAAVTVTGKWLSYHDSPNFQGRLWKLNCLSVPATLPLLLVPSLASVLVLQTLWGESRRQRGRKELERGELGFGDGAEVGAGGRGQRRGRAQGTVGIQLRQPLSLPVPRGPPRPASRSWAGQVLPSPPYWPLSSPHLGASAGQGDRP